MVPFATEGAGRLLSRSTLGSLVPMLTLLIYANVGNDDARILAMCSQVLVDSAIPVLSRLSL
jgi:hypothetical protein